MRFIIVQILCVLLLIPVARAKITYLEEDNVGNARRFDMDPVDFKGLANTVPSSEQVPFLESDGGNFVVNIVKPVEPGMANSFSYLYAIFTEPSEANQILQEINIKGIPYVGIEWLEWKPPGGFRKWCRNAGRAINHSFDSCLRRFLYFPVHN